MWTVSTHWQSALMDNYGTPKLTLVRGEGAKVWDADGKEYVDLVGGIAVNALGHAHPAVVEAVTEQIKQLGHTSNLYVNPVAVELAEALLDVAGLTGHGKVLFVNSGAEANEAALKISRLTGRTKVIAAEGAFHGRTMGALTLTGQPGKRDPFKPLVPGVEHVPFGDVGGAEGGRRHRDRGRLPGAGARARRASSRRRTATCRPPARSPRPPARCWCSTRCRPVSAGSAPGSATSRPASCRT